jgi:hypothetical protein
MANLTCEMTLRLREQKENLSLKKDAIQGISLMKRLEMKLD